MLDRILGTPPQRIGTTKDGGFDDVAVLADPRFDRDHSGYAGLFGGGRIEWRRPVEEPTDLNDTLPGCKGLPRTTPHD